MRRAVASLGWVSPGAATEGVAPIFFLKKTGDLFQSSPSLAMQFCGVTRFLSPKKLTTFFAPHCQFLLISVVCHPLEGVTPHLFYLSDPVCPLFFVNLPTKKLGVTRGAILPHPLMTPLVCGFLNTHHLVLSDSVITYDRPIYLHCYSVKLALIKSCFTQ